MENELKTFRFSCVNAIFQFPCLISRFFFFLVYHQYFMLFLTSSLWTFPRVDWTIWSTVMWSSSLQIITIIVQALTEKSRQKSRWTEKCWKIDFYLQFQSQISMINSKPFPYVNFNDKNIPKINKNFIVDILCIQSIYNPQNILYQNFFFVSDETTLKNSHDSSHFWCVVFKVTWPNETSPPQWIEKMWEDQHRC